MTDLQIAIFALSAHVVQCRRARSTGTVVSVLDNRTGAWSQDGKWITHCHDHASICEHDTRSCAVAWAAEPEGWCEPCRV